jgi:tetratricopeptide (TPR) repeat protein
VIGKEFPLALAREVVKKPDDELNRMLARLQLAEFVYEQPATGDVEFTFKHALTREVAYGSLLGERRRVLHERIGAGLESTYFDRLDDQVAQLAHHYVRSGNPDKAVEYCLRAVQKCVRRASFAEAVTQFETGVAQLQRFPDDDRRAELELDLRNAVNLAMVTIKGYGSPESEQFSRQTILLCQRPRIDWEKSWLALAGIFPVLLTRPDLRGACEIGKELVERAEQHGNPERIAHGCQLLGFASLEAGAFDFANQQFERGAMLYDSMPKPRASLSSERFLQQALIQILWAWNSWVAGYPERALERMSTATAVARDVNSKVIWDSVHHFGCRVYQLRANMNSLREWAELTRQSTAELGNRFRHGIGDVYLGWTDVDAGEFDGGIERMREGLDEIRNTGAEIGTGYYLALIATALSRMGKFDEGLRNVDEGLSVIERTGDRVYEAEVRRIRGELLLAQDSSNAAQGERIFRTAIEIARSQKAKSWELRATMSLARLLAKQGKRDESRTMLADIYNWFTEGLDTADLRDAKALLDHLSG